MNNKEEEIIIILLACMLFLVLALFLNPAINGFAVYNLNFSCNTSLINNSDGYRLIPAVSSQDYSLVFSNAEDVFISEQYQHHTFSIDKKRNVDERESRKTRYLIKFKDINIPENAVVNSAKLYLWIDREKKTGILSLYEIDNWWIEGNCNCKLPRSGKYGCTWNYSALYYEAEGESVLWSNIGGDYSDLIDSAEIYDENVIMLDVKNYLENANGWILTGDSENGAKSLYSTKADDFGKRPYIAVNYSVLNYDYSSADVLTEDFFAENLSSWNSVYVNYSGQIGRYYSADSGGNWNELISDDLTNINSSSIMFRFVLDSADDVLYSAVLNYSLIEITENESSNETGNYTEPVNQTLPELNETIPEIPEHPVEQSPGTSPAGAGSGAGPSSGGRSSSAPALAVETNVREEAKELKLYQQFEEKQPELQEEAKELVAKETQQSSGKFNFSLNFLIPFAGLLFGLFSTFLIYHRKIRR